MDPRNELYRRIDLEQDSEHQHCIFMLKGTVSRDLLTPFFIILTHLGALFRMLEYFGIWFRFQGSIRMSKVRAIFVMTSASLGLSNKKQFIGLRELKSRAQRSWLSKAKFRVRGCYGHQRVENLRYRFEYIPEIEATV